MYKNFFDLSYLKNGTRDQQKAYEVLLALDIFQLLKLHSPVLVGTFPLAINTSSSDLDILCYCPELDQFEQSLRTNFERFENFSLRRKCIKQQWSVIASFRYADHELEIFGQNKAVEKQAGYLHLLIEDQLLNQAGDEARKAIIELKKSGIKTEPAFAQYFGILGDPYEQLLIMAKQLSDSQF